MASLARSFFAYDQSFTGGVTVAAENYNGDAGDEIITGTGQGAPHVKIFQPDGIELGSFFAYSQQFTGGVFVAVGDMDLNGKSEIVTGPGAGGSPNVRVFNGGNATLLSSFFAFDQQFLGGVTVGLTDVNYDGFEDIVAAAGPGGAPEVSIWNSASTELSSFSPMTPLLEAEFSLLDLSASLCNLTTPTSIPLFSLFIQAALNLEAQS